MIAFCRVDDREFYDVAPPNNSLTGTITTSLLFTATNLTDQRVCTVYIHQLPLAHSSGHDAMRCTRMTSDYEHTIIRRRKNPTADKDGPPSQLCTLFLRQPFLSINPIPSEFCFARVIFIPFIGDGLIFEFNIHSDRVRRQSYRIQGNTRRSSPPRSKRYNVTHKNKRPLILSKFCEHDR